MLQRWFGDIDGLFARGKILYPDREGYNVIIPDALSVLCHFANGAEGVLEFSGIHAHATGDRLEVYGSTEARISTLDIARCLDRKIDRRVSPESAPRASDCGELKPAKRLR